MFQYEDTDSISLNNIPAVRKKEIKEYLNTLYGKGAQTIIMPKKYIVVHPISPSEKSTVAVIMKDAITAIIRGEEYTMIDTPNRLFEVSDRYEDIIKEII